MKTFTSLLLLLFIGCTISQETIVEPDLSDIWLGTYHGSSDIDSYGCEGDYFDTYNQIKCTVSITKESINAIEVNLSIDGFYSIYGARLSGTVFSEGYFEAEYLDTTNDGAYWRYVLRLHRSGNSIVGVESTYGVLAGSGNTCSSVEVLLSEVTFSVSG